MGKYNFDEQIDRHNTNSYKWDLIQRHFGEEDVLGMWTADMDFRCPEPMLNVIRKKLDHGVLGYTIRSSNYYEIIQGWTRRHFGWTPEKDDIHVCPPGVIPAVSMLVNVLTEPGDPIFTFMPNYDSLYGVAENTGRRLVTARLINDNGIWKMDINAFEEAVIKENIKCAIMCSPHNPVGRVWTKDELDAFASVCIRHNVFVISDEVHCDIVRKGIVHTPMGTVGGMEELSATLMSPNKTFNVAGLMTASVFIHNKEVMAKYRKALSSLGMTLDGVFSTVAVEALYTDPGCEDWLEECKDYIDRNLNYAVNFINSRLPGVTTTVPEGTYLLWIDFSGTKYKGAALREFLVKKCRVDMCEGEDFDPNCHDHMRLNCACTRATLEEALHRLEIGFC